MANEVRLIDGNALRRKVADILRRYDTPETFGEKLAVYSVFDEVVSSPTIDPESLKSKGHWDIRCDYCVDVVTREADESFYLECSECKRKVWDVNQMAAMNGEYRKLIEQYPYCHCGCKMEG